MIGLLRTGWIVSVGVVLVLAVAACGDDEAADPERFCEIIAETGSLIDSFMGGLGASPDEARETISEARNLIDEAEAVAPEVIRTSVDVAADRARLWFDLIEEADFYALQVDGAEFTAASGSPEVVAARELSEELVFSLGEWIETNCSFG